LVAMPKQAKTKTVSINLRLPADLHKALVKAGTSGSPPRSLNSEILSRLYENFEAAALENEVRDVSAQIENLEKETVARVKEVETRAHEMAQRVESRLAEVDELKRLVKAKLK
jgi:hypothetical protein